MAFHMMIRRTGHPWRCEFHLFSDQVVKSTVLAVVDGGSKLKNTLNSDTYCLPCQQEVGCLRAVAVEGESRVAISASTRSPVVLGVFTWETILDCLKKEFLLCSFAGLEPFSDSRIFALPASVLSSGRRPGSFASTATCYYRLHSFHEVITLPVVFVCFVLVGMFRTCLKLCSDREFVSMVCSEMSFSFVTYVSSCRFSLCNTEN